MKEVPEQSEAKSLCFPHWGKSDFKSDLGPSEQSGIFPV
jgi:hypothetical protein